MSIVNPLHARVYWPFKGGATFVDPFCHLCVMLVFVMPSCLFLAALWSPDGRDSLLALLCVVFSCVLSLSDVVSGVECGSWLYQFLIFAFFFTLNNRICRQVGTLMSPSYAQSDRCICFPICVLHCTSFSCGVCITVSVYVFWF